MMETCANVLIQNFQHWGIDHIFGIPGKVISPIIFATDGKEIEFVLSKHESGGGFEAAGYSLMTNKIGVAIGTSGPGGTNLLTAAGQAKASNIPLLIITGNPAIKDTGRATGQDSTIFGTDLVEMFKSVTKFSIRVERGDMLEIYLKHALEKAFSGVKGPVHLSIPFDILMEEIEPFKLDLPSTHAMISPLAENVIERLNNAKRPLLFLGKGVHSSRAYKEVQMLAEHWNIPVMTTPGGKGTFVSNHRLSLGAFGLGGTEESNQYLRDQVDLLLVIGSKLSDMSMAGFSEAHYPKHIIHFDYDETFIGKTMNVSTTPVLGDIRANLNFILRNVEQTDQPTFLTPKVKNVVEVYNEDEWMTAEATLKVVRNTLPDDAVLFGDDGSHTFYGIKYFDIYEPGTYFFDDIFGAMGHAIGYAIGAKLGAPKKTIVCLTGDGCMFMHGTEISTAINSGAAVLFIVLNNSRLDMVEKGMRKMIGKSIGAVYKQPLNVAAFAESMGVQSFRCSNPLELEDALYQSLNILEQTNKPVVVEVLVDPDEIPPTMGRQ